jgi:hypothetical protein
MSARTGRKRCSISSSCAVGREIGIATYIARIARVGRSLPHRLEVPGEELVEQFGVALPPMLSK